MSTFRIAAAQMVPRLGDIEANLAQYEAQLRAARDGGVDLLVFPELSLTGYFLKDMVSTVALRLDSPQVRKLSALSRQTAFVAGLVEETDDFRFHNSAVYFEDGKIRHVHRKVYLPTYGLFDEGRYFARGREIRSFPSKFGQSMKAKPRRIPGAIFRDISAASMGMVPAPQKGSIKGDLRFQSEAIKIPAARVSLKGALAVASRYPRLWSSTPEESRLKVQWFSTRRTTINCGGLLFSSPPNFFVGGIWPSRAPMDSRTRSVTAAE